MANDAEKLLREAAELLKDAEFEYAPAGCYAKQDDVLERIRAHLATPAPSAGEPVAYQRRLKVGFGAIRMPTVDSHPWEECGREEATDMFKMAPGYEYRPLYATPPVVQSAVLAAEWLPIESAPKGGGAERTDDPKWVQPPTILLRCGSEGCAIGYWDWYYAEGGNGCTDGVAWTEKFTGDPLSLHFATPPDGWQPLPAAPTSAASLPDAKGE